MVDDASHDVTEILRNKQKMVDAARIEVDNFHKHVRAENEKHKERMEKNDIEYAKADERLSMLKTELAALRERIA